MRKKHGCVLGGECGTCKFCLPSVRLQRAILLAFAARDAMRELDRSDPRRGAAAAEMRALLPLGDISELLVEEVSR